jgi:hypothetical protein
MLLDPVSFKILKSFCWDIDINTLDLDRHKRFIIERILKLGRPEHVRWLLDTFSKEAIVSVVKISKNIDKRTASFWALHFNIPREEVLCLNRPLMQPCFY